MIFSFLKKVPNSIAAVMGKGKIMQGDQLLEINGQNVRESNQKDVANQINQMDGEIVLLLGNHMIYNVIEKKTKIINFSSFK